jgi:hypothetical protein
MSNHDQEVIATASSREDEERRLCSIESFRVDSRTVKRIIEVTQQLDLDLLVMSDEDLAMNARRRHSAHDMARPAPRFLREMILRHKFVRHGSP